MLECAYACIPAALCTRGFYQSNIFEASSVISSDYCRARDLLFVRISTVFNDTMLLCVELSKLIVGINNFDS